MTWQLHSGAAISIFSCTEPNGHAAGVERQQEAARNKIMEVQQVSLWHQAAAGELSACEGVARQSRQQASHEEWWAQSIAGWESSR